MPEKSDPTVSCLSGIGSTSFPRETAEVVALAERGVYHPVEMAVVALAHQLKVLKGVVPRLSPSR
jgi:hypothetical protein